jgi:hypothetical protein
VQSVDRNDHRLRSRIDRQVQGVAGADDANVRSLEHVAFLAWIDGDASPGFGDYDADVVGVRMGHETGATSGDAHGEWEGRGAKHRRGRRKKRLEGGHCTHDNIVPNATADRENGPLADIRRQGRAIAFHDHTENGDATAPYAG